MERIELIASAQNFVGSVEGKAIGVAVRVSDLAREDTTRTLLGVGAFVAVFGAMAIISEVINRHDQLDSNEIKDK